MRRLFFAHQLQRLKTAESTFEYGRFKPVYYAGGFLRHAFAMPDCDRRNTSSDDLERPKSLAFIRSLQPLGVFKRPCEPDDTLTFFSRKTARHDLATVRYPFKRIFDSATYLDHRNAACPFWLKKTTDRFRYCGYCPCANMPRHVVAIIRSTSERSRENFVSFDRNVCAQKRQTPTEAPGRNPNAKHYNRKQSVSSKIRRFSEELNRVLCFFSNQAFFFFLQHGKNRCGLDTSLFTDTPQLLYT